MRGRGSARGSNRTMGRGGRRGGFRAHGKTDVPRVKRRRDDEELDDDKDEGFFAAAEVDVGGEDEDDDDTRQQSVAETTEAKRLRIAKSYLQQVMKSTKKRDREDGEEEEGDGESDGEEEEGEIEGVEEHADIGAKLHQTALEQSGRALRSLASRLSAVQSSQGLLVGRRHRQSITAVALSSDDRRGFAVSKDGVIVEWDVERGLDGSSHSHSNNVDDGSDARRPQAGSQGGNHTSSGAKSTGHTVVYPWPAPGSPSLSSRAAAGNVQEGSLGGRKGKARAGGSKHLLSLAVSSDGRYLAAGGYDRKVHVWDARTRTHVRAFSGHRGAITSLAFRPNSLDLMSASTDRSVKLWSVSEMAYVDSLFGHQSDVLCLCASMRQERALTVARDRTARLWKIPEESQLVFRAPSGASMESCAFISSSHFLTGCDDGSVALWSTLRKKAAHVVRQAHSHPAAQATAQSASSVPPKNGLLPHTETHTNPHSSAPNGCSNASDNEGSGVAAGTGSAVDAWVGAVSVCDSSDLAASGAGNGVICLWNCDTEAQRLHPLATLPATGFVNSMAFAHDGRFLIAGIGQEPRLGRWARNAGARNNVLLHKLDFDD